MVLLLLSASGKMVLVAKGKPFPCRWKFGLWSPFSFDYCVLSLSLAAMDKMVIVALTGNLFQCHHPLCEGEFSSVMDGIVVDDEKF